MALGRTSFLKIFILHDYSKLRWHFSFGQQASLVYVSKSLVCSIFEKVRVFFPRPLSQTHHEYKAYGPVLLERKAEKIRKNLDSEKGQMKTVRTIFDVQGLDRS